MSAIPRFMIAAGASGSGKTLITCGILQALKKRGIPVSSFKCGPDYIDPMFHEKVLQVKSRNLDTFFTDGDMTGYLLQRGAQGTDVSVIEGVMGYYDGLGGTELTASSYDLARKTKTPAVLAVNARGMSLSVLAHIQGFMNFRKDSGIAGVILNQMSAMLYPKIKERIEEELRVKVLGYVPEVRELTLESRHLGLLLPDEVQHIEKKLQQFAGLLEETLDLDGLLELAGTAPELETSVPPGLRELLDSEAVRSVRGKKPVIAVARDEAFCFIYEDNLQLLRDMGAEMVTFSPVHDEKLPEGITGLLLYGGYPELCAEQLMGNTSMKKSIGSALQAGLPCMAECGGFMYLHESMEDMNGNLYSGVGAVAAKAYRTGKLVRFGYIDLYSRQEDSPGSGTGRLKGHEFHYFDSTDCGEAYLAVRPVSKKSWNCIHADRQKMMGFPHLYYYSDPETALKFLEKCTAYGGVKS